MCTNYTSDAQVYVYLFAFSSSAYYLLPTYVYRYSHACVQIICQTHKYMYIRMLILSAVCITYMCI